MPPPLVNLTQYRIQLEFSKLAVVREASSLDEMMPSRLNISFKSVVRSSAGTKADMSPAKPLLEQIPDLESWAKQLKIPPKELKLADRQTLLLYRTILDLLEENPGLDLKNVPVHVAVGPARTNLTHMQSWESRIVPGEPWPMIQPASAIGLLPNTPLSWVSIKLGLRGEGAVWAGFHEAGYCALTAGIEALQSEAEKVVVASVNSPDNYFVKNTLQRAGLQTSGSLFPTFASSVPFCGSIGSSSPTFASSVPFCGSRGSSVEIGVALLLEVSDKSPALLFHEAFPRNTDLKTIGSFYSEHLNISSRDFIHSAFCEGVYDRFQISEKFGDPMTALFPFSLAMAEKISHDKGFCSFVQGDLFGNIQSGVVKTA